MLDTSDEATDLPPLADVAVEDSLLALAWTIGTDGIVTLMDEDMAVHYLSVRGLAMDDDGVPYFEQRHIALPAEHLRPLLEEWLSRLS